MYTTPRRRVWGLILEDHITLRNVTTLDIADLIVHIGSLWRGEIIEEERVFTLRITLKADRERLLCDLKRERLVAPHWCLTELDEHFLFIWENSTKVSLDCGAGEPSGEERIETRLSSHRRSAVSWGSPSPSESSSRSTTQPRGSQLFFDLGSLSKEELGAEADEVEKIMNTIRGFGLKKEWEFTTKQWKRLRDMIKKQYPKVHEWQLDSQPEEDLVTIAWKNDDHNSASTGQEEARWLYFKRTGLPAPHLPSFVERRSSCSTGRPCQASRRSGRCPDESDRGDWRGWHDQLDYFIKILSEERPDLPVLLDPVEKVLERHGRTTGGFLSPPDRLLLLRDLQAIVGHGLGSYRKFKVETISESNEEFNEKMKPGSISLPTTTLSSVNFKLSPSKKLVSPFSESIQHQDRSNYLRSASGDLIRPVIGSNDLVSSDWILEEPICGTKVLAI